MKTKIFFSTLIIFLIGLNTFSQNSEAPDTLEIWMDWRYQAPVDLDSNFHWSGPAVLGNCFFSLFVKVPGLYTIKSEEGPILIIRVLPGYLHLSGDYVFGDKFSLYWTAIADSNTTIFIYGMDNKGDINVIDWISDSDRCCSYLDLTDEMLNEYQEFFIGYPTDSIFIKSNIVKLSRTE